jgi:hypothetical protein
MRLSFGDAKGAIEDCNEAIRLNNYCHASRLISPQFFLTYECRAQSKYVLGDTKGATDDFCHAITSEPTLSGVAEVLEGLGWVVGFKAQNDARQQINAVCTACFRAVSVPGNFSKR